MRQTPHGGRPIVFVSALASFVVQGHGHAAPVAQLDEHKLRSGQEGYAKESLENSTLYQLYQCIWVISLLTKIYKLKTQDFVL